jgi:hypothetical protein
MLHKDGVKVGGNFYKALLHCFVIFKATLRSASCGNKIKVKTYAARSRGLVAGTVGCISAVQISATRSVAVTDFLRIF